MKEITYDFLDVQNALALKIANLEIELANERAAKSAIIKYAESLEEKIEELLANKGSESR